ncbi:hypothetical protein RXV86_20695 [Alisedimentitalea sp. MJ-SS2]|uniref:hypothetical protein n=1 Tax=Aliisedimentitalea sp. MJ-SS2 TaxID=3049795 RepID=UPI00291327C7|nr:hypothetical protein [Alisedimentitalea sp. MJ-SS2]MDU8929813.1 hypothetical protein [Alisedimentitalea sp. MJ-SS2]
MDGSQHDGVFVLKPRLLGVGEDKIIGGPSGQSYQKIDLSQLTYPVDIDWSSPDCGSITDGADTIVFQGVDEIILPPCMREAASPPTELAS